jgi:hypothetical protein
VLEGGPSRLTKGARLSWNFVEYHRQNEFGGFRTHVLKFVSSDDSTLNKPKNSQKARGTST